MKLTLEILPETLHIHRFPPNTPLRDHMLESGFVSITRTADELSVVTSAAIDEATDVERGWRAFRVQGKLDFSLTGIVAEISTALAEAEVSVFTIATFDTDFVLVPKDRLGAALRALKARGHDVLGA